MAEDQDMQQEPRDYTRLVWAGIVVLIIIMLGAVWLSGQRKPDVSTVVARHILIGCDMGDPADRQRALELAADLRQRIVEGESMARLAREYSSDDMSSARGGLLRPFTRRDQLEAKFNEYVWNAPVGELSQIIPTNYGFHIVQVEERYLSEGDVYARELERRAKEALTGDGEDAAGDGEESAPSVPTANTPALPTAPLYE